MFKKIIAVLLSFLIFASLYYVRQTKAYAYSSIVEEEMNRYLESKDEERKKKMNKVVDDIFQNVFINHQISYTKYINLELLFGDVVGDEQEDIIFIIELENASSLVVVYERQKGEYIYCGIVENFMNLKGIQLMPIKDGDKKLIVVREYSDQMLGAYEKAVFVRAYKYTNKGFELVLNILEEYEAYWNELWDNSISKENKYWLAVKQSAEVSWASSLYPAVNVLLSQSYSKSKDFNEVYMPIREDFIVVEERMLDIKYSWSEKWQHFILFEAKCSKTEETLAVIEDASFSIFDLVYTDERYRVKRENGKIEYVLKTEVK